MKALCVTEDRKLELRDIAWPSNPPPGWVNVNITAAAINHGDITFLNLRGAASLATGTRLENVWGASAAGTITSVGSGVPNTYLGRKVALYRGLEAAAPALGLWCQTAQIPYGACLLLPDDVDIKDYSGSLVNVVTAYAFLEEIEAEGHRGVIVTAGGSATGRAISVLARRRAIPVLLIVRSESAKQELLKSGVDEENILKSGDSDFMIKFEERALKIGATAVFDGVGGSSISQLIGGVPPRSSIYFYGFLSGPEKVSFPSAVFMMKDLTMKRFSNFETVTVKDQGNKLRMLKELESCIADPLFKTRMGKDFELVDIEAALEYEGTGGSKAVLMLSK
jgi:NADPH:quinone reductase